MRYTATVGQIRKSISERPFPPKSTDDAWIDSSIINSTNCFAYAINSTCATENARDMYTIIKDNDFDEEEPYCAEEIRDAFEATMQCLGIDYCRVQKDGRRPNYSYRIALCNYMKGRDFHFVRQNKNGSWTHKRGWYSLPSLVCKETENLEKKLKSMGYEIIAFYAIKQLKP